MKAVIEDIKGSASPEDVARVKEEILKEGQFAELESNQELKLYAEVNNVCML